MRVRIKFESQATIFFLLNRPQNLAPTLPTATRILSEREAADVRFGSKGDDSSGGRRTRGGTPKKRNDKLEKEETPTKNL